MRPRRINATRDKRDPFAVSRDAHVEKWSARSEQLSQLPVREIHRKDSLCVFVGFGMIGSRDNELLTRGNPCDLTELPGSRNEFAHFVRVYVEEPEAGGLIIFIDNVGVVFVLFF